MSIYQQLNGSGRSDGNMTRATTEQRLAFLKLVRSRREELLRPISPSLSREDKAKAWRQVFDFCLSIGMQFPPGKDWTYVRDAFWPNLRKATLVKKDKLLRQGLLGESGSLEPCHSDLLGSSGLTDIDDVILDILEADPPITSNAPSYNAQSHLVTKMRAASPSQLDVPSQLINASLLSQIPGAQQFPLFRPNPGSTGLCSVDGDNIIDNLATTSAEFHEELAQFNKIKAECLSPQIENSNGNDSIMNPNSDNNNQINNSNRYDGKTCVNGNQLRGRTVQAATTNNNLSPPVSIQHESFNKIHHATSTNTYLSNSHNTSESNDISATSLSVHHLTEPEIIPVEDVSSSSGIGAISLSGSPVVTTRGASLSPYQHATAKRTLSTDTAGHSPSAEITGRKRSRLLLDYESLRNHSLSELERRALVAQITSSAASFGPSSSTVQYTGLTNGVDGSHQQTVSSDATGVRIMQSALKESMPANSTSANNNIQSMIANQIELERLENVRLQNENLRLQNGKLRLEAMLLEQQLFPSRPSVHRPPVATNVGSTPYSLANSLNFPTPGAIRQPANGLLPPNLHLQMHQSLSNSVQQPAAPHTQSEKK